MLAHVSRALVSPKLQDLSLLFSFLKQRPFVLFWLQKFFAAAETAVDRR